MTQPRIPAIQTEITEDMRNELNGWIVQVHLKFLLLPETLYIAINLIDRYLEHQVVIRGHY